uniref:Uncharacterized protein n=1 Tax=Astyanax mexicanus TaxID=7994 RepID=A0A3B1JKL9_ASTMX
MANKSAPEDKPHKQEEEDLRLEIEKLKSENEKIRYNFDQYKERMGRAVDIKLGCTEMMSEDLNNPCSESKLRDMYMNLDFSEWAKFREQLKAAMKEKDSEFTSNLEKAKRCIKEVLKQAQHDIQDNKKKLKQNFLLNTINPKTSQFYDLAIHYIQMAIFHEKKMPVPLHTEWKDIPGLQTLAEECYRIVSLMVLHNPPIVLDWDKQGQNIFPPLKIGEVESSATASTDQNEQCEGNEASIQPTADAVPPNQTEQKEQLISKLEELDPQIQNCLEEKKVESITTAQNVPCEGKDVSKKSTTEEPGKPETKRQNVEEAVSHPQEEMQIHWEAFKIRAQELLSMIPSDCEFILLNILVKDISLKCSCESCLCKYCISSPTKIHYHILVFTAVPLPPEAKLKELRENLIPTLTELEQQFQKIKNICTIRQENAQIFLEGDAKRTDESQTKEQTDSDYGIGSLQIKEVSHLNV